MSANFCGFIKGVKYRFTLKDGTCRKVTQLLKTLSFYLRRRRWHPIPVLLPGKSHGWRSLVGYSPWGHKESDMTE